MAPVQNENTDIMFIGYTEELRSCYVLLISGDPSKRMQGAFGYLGFFTLWGCSIYSGLKMAGIA